MGAEGNIVIAKVSEYKKHNPDIPACWICPYVGEFLGEECMWGYFGEPSYTPNYAPDRDYYGNIEEDAFKYHPTDWDKKEELDQETKQKWEKACDWFEVYSEVHEVWT